MLSAWRRRLADERGFTLIELLMATLIGTIVMLAASNLLDASGRASLSVQGRAEAVDRGRKALEEITTRLRAQTCLNEFTPALVRGDSNSMDFYTVYGAREPRAIIYGNSPQTLDVAQARRITYASGRITEQVWSSPLPYSSAAPNNPAVPAAVFSGAPNVSREIVRRVAPAKEGDTTLPIFRYYTFQNNNPATPDKLLPTPIAPADLAKVVRIEVAFDAQPDNNDGALRGGDRSSQTDTTLQSEVFVRTADAGQPETSPECF